MTIHLLLRTVDSEPAATVARCLDCSAIIWIDWINLAASTVAASITVLIYLLAISHFRRSGPVVEVHLGYRWNNAKKDSSRPINDDRTPPEETMYDPAKSNHPGWVVAITVSNRGRSPTSILSLVLREKGSIPYQPAFLYDPPLPTYLRPGEVKVFMVAPIGLIPRPGEATRTIMATAATIAEGENQDTDSMDLVIKKPLPPLPDIPGPVRRYLRDTGLGI